MMKKALILMMCFIFFSSSVHAQDSDIENRVHEIGRSLRCVVCQNQSIDMSDAPLAVDMRELVRERVVAGDSNKDVIEHLQSIYGDYVLLKPPVQKNTYVLWFLPFLILLSSFTVFALKSTTIKCSERTGA